MLGAEPKYISCMRLSEILEAFHNDSVKGFLPRENRYRRIQSICEIWVLILQKSRYLIDCGG